MIIDKRFPELEELLKKIYPNHPITMSKDALKRRIQDADPVLVEENQNDIKKVFERLMRKKTGRSHMGGAMDPLFNMRHPYASALGALLAITHITLAERYPTYRRWTDQHILGPAERALVAYGEGVDYLFERIVNILPAPHGSGAGREPVGVRVRREIDNRHRRFIETGTFGGDGERAPGH